MKFLFVGKSPQLAAGKIQPLLLFLMGVGFIVMGFRIYPAFIGVGVLFLIIGYRGYTCRRDRVR